MFKEQLTEKEKIAIKIVIANIISSSLSTTGLINGHQLIGNPIENNEENKAKVIDYLHKSNLYTAALNNITQEDLDATNAFGKNDFPLNTPDDFSRAMTSLGGATQDKKTVYKLLGLLAIKYLPSLKRHFATALFALLMAITRQRNCTMSALSRRATGLAAWLGQPSVDCSVSEIGSIWNLIEMNVKRVGIEHILDVLTTYTEASGCVVLTPLIVQASWRNMTAIRLIYDAMAEFTFLGDVAKIAKIIGEEMVNFGKYLTILNKDTTLVLNTQV